MSKSGLWLTYTSPLLSSPLSPPLTHTPPTHPRHVAVRAHSLCAFAGDCDAFVRLLCCMANRSDMALMVVAWHLVPPWPPTPLALDHGLQRVRIGDGMAIHHPHDLNMATYILRAHDLKLTPIEAFRHAPTLPHYHLITWHESWWLVANHCGFHTGRVGGWPWTTVPLQLYQAPVILHAVQNG